MDAPKAPDWMMVVFRWQGGDGLNDQRPIFTDWVRSLGLNPDGLADRAAIVSDTQGRYWLHVDETYRVEGFVKGKTAGPDVVDPLNPDEVLTRRRIVEVQPHSWPALAKVS